MRTITAYYADPVDVVWIAAALRCGIRIRRDDTVYASWDGAGALTIGTPETLDPDDCLAQLILHEICHALVEGPEAMKKIDWGLDITNPAQLVREHACLRVQAAMADTVGMRRFFGATTDARKYYDQLPSDPLTGDDPAVEPAKRGYAAATTGPWAEHLRIALTDTSQIAAIVSESSQELEAQLKAEQSLSCMWSRTVIESAPG